MGEEYKIGDIVLGNWTLNRLIGEGSYGKVYEADREDFGVTYKAAIKIITIPQNKSELKSVMSEGMDKESVTDYFRTMAEEIVREFSLMSRLKGTANVVSYEDHAVIPHEDAVGWDIIIRMELLTPLLDYINSVAFTCKDTVKLGIDLCRALELCQRFNIVHRDIKPENIFVSELGDYKLGDFGIARTIDKTSSGLSKKGTYTYMAPEVYKENAYGPSVDIYSLGLVLYRLLNDNRAPFLPQYPAPITFNDRETALARRMAGEDLPAPHHADNRLTEIVLKACAYDPKDRYSNPAEMRNNLETVMVASKEVSHDIIAISNNSNAITKSEILDEQTQGIFYKKQAPSNSNIDATECIVSSKRTANQEQHKIEQSVATNSNWPLSILLLTLVLFPKLFWFIRTSEAMQPIFLQILQNKSLTLSGLFIWCVLFFLSFLLPYLIFYFVGEVFLGLYRRKKQQRNLKAFAHLKTICISFFVALLISISMMKEMQTYMLVTGMASFFPAAILCGYLLLNTIPCLVRQRRRLKRKNSKIDILQERTICVQTMLSLLLYTGIKSVIFFIGMRASHFVWVLTVISMEEFEWSPWLFAVSVLLVVSVLVSGLSVIIICFCNMHNIKKLHKCMNVASDEL